MTPISTRQHGILDYASAAALFLLPRALRWNHPLKWFLTVMAVKTLGYSLITRYELSAKKLLPLRTHLMLDTFSGVMMGLSPMLLRSRSPLVNLILRGFGLFEIAASLMTEKEEPPLPDDQPPAPEFAVPINEREYLRT